MDLKRNFFEIFIVTLSLFLVDLLVPNITVTSILDMFIIAIVFVVIFNLFLSYIKNGVALFIGNMFLFYVLSLIFNTFYIGSLLGLFLLTIVFSIVDAVMTAEDKE